MSMAKPIVGLLARTSLAVMATAAVVSGASAAEKVMIGVVNSSSDIALFIADAKGYYKDAGIEASFNSFDSAAKMIAPLGTGKLDVGAGAASSGLYNAVARHRLRVVADKARDAPGYGFQAFMVRHGTM